jgi:hypothetical protein
MLSKIQSGVNVFCFKVANSKLFDESIGNVSSKTGVSAELAVEVAGGVLEFTNMQAAATGAVIGSQSGFIKDDSKTPKNDSRRSNPHATEGKKLAANVKQQHFEQPIGKMDVSERKKKEFSRNFSEQPPPHADRRKNQASSYSLDLPKNQRPSPPKKPLFSFFGNNSKRIEFLEGRIEELEEKLMRLEAFIIRNNKR